MTSSHSKKEDYTLTIHYTLNFNNDSWQNNKTGLLWTLSYLGATLPKNSFDKSIVSKGKQTFTINFENLGFTKRALQTLVIILDSLKKTDAYKKRKAVDLGHFITLTLGSSWHYYQITDVPKTYQEFIELHKFTKYELMPITKSSISHHHRMLKMKLDDIVQQSAFVAEEGDGDLLTNTFNALEYEAMDVMKNGQLRFMIYDQGGKLVSSSVKKFGDAGKPAKCIWCHEIVIQPLFVNTDTLLGYMSPVDFQRKIRAQNDLLTLYRAGLDSDIDFSRVQDHTYQELIYISFMEPSVRRLSQEWRMSEKKVRHLLKSLPTHKHHEFSFLGDLVNRSEIKTLTKYSLGQLPGNIRDETESEPNFFKRVY
ncbi:hypothetical protein CNR22_11055 [Sphingobacteriaceae bacterium]|nr:hypothetical protein CNR22_11055 [Sphingobacteriaceae bacterium]